MDKKKHQRTVEGIPEEPLFMRRLLDKIESLYPCWTCTNRGESKIHDGVLVGFSVVDEQRCESCKAHYIWARAREEIIEAAQKTGLPL